MPFKHITDAQQASFLSALRAGRYSLLLGAGSSMDSENHKGRLPNGNAFKNELCKLKGIGDNYSLQRVYSLLKPEEVDKHVTKRFTGVKAGATAKLISSFIWRRIFTWNIDDALEDAYKVRTARQKLVPLHFSDDFTEAETLAELQLIYLHGSVLSPEKGYVFSRNEYVSNIRNISHWMTVLTQLMRTEPIVISGTTLDEIDLEFYLSHRTQTASREDRGPSIFVEMADDAITRDICERHNLIHFVGYSQDFFSYCTTILPHRPTPYELIPEETRKLFPTGVTNVAALAFQADFELVPGSAQKSSEVSRFLYGYPPSWQDLASNLDISRPPTSGIITKVEERLADVNNDIKVILISESAGAGKTTILKRAAFELAGRGPRVLLCSSLGRLSRSTASVIDLIDEPVVLVIDNFADQASSIVDLLAMMEKKDVIILAAERSYRFRFLDTLLSGYKFLKYDRLPLTPTDVDRLINQYQKFGLTGDHRAQKRRSGFIKEVTSDPISIACCRIMNVFDPLDKIIDGLLEAATESDINRYIIAAIARLTFTGGVRYEVLSSIVNNNGMKSQITANHPLQLAYSDRTGSFVIPENATLGDRALSMVSERDRERVLKCFIALANGIAPRVNRTMIIRRSPEARMAGRLFDYDDVVGRFLAGEADRFYAETRDAWQWNSRYWEQVSLVNLAHYYRDPDSAAGKTYLLTAVQHARNAVSIEQHPFPLSTLGKVLMSQMIADKNPRPSVFGEALMYFNEAIDLEAKWARSAPQPYVSLFNGTMKYLEQGGVLSSAQEETIRRHMVKAEARFPRDNEIYSLLTKLDARLWRSSPD